MSTSVDSAAGLLRGLEREKRVLAVTDSYLQYFSGDDDSRTTGQDSGSSWPSAATKRQESAAAMTSHYYDIATDFYEYGWGESFHFSVLHKKDTKEQASLRHEYRLAMKLALVKGEKVLDMGCGIGGPARHIAAFSGCHVTGLNINRHQIARCQQLSADANLSHLVNFVECDFTNSGLESEAYDKAYALDATCHAAKLEDVYGETFRLLKPGGMFALYEWCMTDRYDPSNKYHNAIKADILVGDGLSTLYQTSEAVAAMKKVGFELLEAEDLAETCQVPWYYHLQSRCTLSGFRMSALGRWSTHLMLVTMEATGLAPRGITKVHRMLCKGADGLARGGEEKIFTPMFFMLGRKPLK